MRATLSIIARSFDSGIIQDIAALAALSLLLLGVVDWSSQGSTVVLVSEIVR